MDLTMTARITLEELLIASFINYAGLEQADVEPTTVTAADGSDIPLDSVLTITLKDTPL